MIVRAIKIEPKCFLVDIFSENLLINNSKSKYGKNLYSLKQLNKYFSEIKKIEWILFVHSSLN